MSARGKSDAPPRESFFRRARVGRPPPLPTPQRARARAITRGLLAGSKLCAGAVALTIVLAAAPSLLEAAGLGRSPAAAPLRPIALAPGESQPGRIHESDPSRGFVFDLRDQPDVDGRRPTDVAPGRPRTPDLDRDPVEGLDAIEELARRRGGRAEADDHERAKAPAKHRVVKTRRPVKALESPRGGALVVGSIDSGESVQVLAEEGDFALVVDSALIMGWVAKSALVPQ